MGGHPKGLLPAPAAHSAATTLVARLVELAQAQGLPVVLVGQRPEYAGLGLPLLADRPAGRGPLGGLAALLSAASERGLDGAVALSCDLPFLGAGLLGRLVAAPAGDFVALAPRWQPADRDTPIWEPLCARYGVAFLPYLEQAMAQGARSLQPLLSQANAQPLLLSPDEQAQVRDWDRPEDLPPALRSAVRARPQ